MATIEKALRIAARAHEGQTEKNGQPYIRRYFLAYKFLTDLLTEDQYRAAMEGTS